MGRDGKNKFRIEYIGLLEQTFKDVSSALRSSLRSPTVRSHGDLDFSWVTGCFVFQQTLRYRFLFLHLHFTACSAASTRLWRERAFTFFTSERNVSCSGVSRNETRRDGKVRFVLSYFSCAVTFSRYERSFFSALKGVISTNRHWSKFDVTGN